MADSDIPNKDEIVIHGNIRPVNLVTEMQNSYLDYAMSVIVGRALPDVKDGFKPVHRRVIYAMYDGGYRPDKGYNKCARVVGDVMGKYHPHGDSAIYETMVRMTDENTWTLRYPLIDGQGNFGTPGDNGAAAPRYTECRMNNLAMEMVRDIDKDTVDFEPNYDQKNLEPTVLPARVPNLLINGSAGIAVGMATNIPPHNLREVAEGAKWYLEHPEASPEELQEVLLTMIKGPDFPTGGKIMGFSGIKQAYRTGRGIIKMRAVIEDEEIKGRQCLVVKQLPYQVNPDSLAKKIRELTRDGLIEGVADMRDETSGRTGTRIVIVLKRDAVAKVVLNNLYKKTQLQESFGANMLALVDGVPRTLSIDKFIRHWGDHQVDVILRRTKYELRKAEERSHIIEALLKALDVIDEVIKVIRASKDTETARIGLKELLSIDDDQANAILEMQLRRLAALERFRLQEEYDDLQAKIAEFKDIISKPERQRSIVLDELRVIVDKYGDDRRTEIVPFEGSSDDEALIPEEEVVITMTKSGYLKRTKADNYRAQHRGGKGVKGAQLKEDDDFVDHFFVTTTHHWLLFFSNLGRVYRLKGYEIAEAGRDAKGQHINNLIELQPDEFILQALDLKSYDQAESLVLATKRGLVKKTALELFDSSRRAGVKAITLKEDEYGLKDEVVSAMLTNDKDTIICVSKKGSAVRFEIAETKIRSLGRSSSGVKGIKFRADDELLAAEVIPADTQVDVVVTTAAGFAKRSDAEEYPIKGRGGFGVKVANVTDVKGELVGLAVTEADDELLVITKSGKIIRSAAAEIRQTGRNSQGVRFANLEEGDEVLSVTKTFERGLEATAGEISDQHAEVEVSPEQTESEEQ